MKDFRRVPRRSCTCIGARMKVMSGQSTAKSTTACFFSLWVAAITRRFAQKCAPLWVYFTVRQRLGPEKMLATLSVHQFIRTSPRIKVDLLNVICTMSEGFDRPHTFLLICPVIPPIVALNKTWSFTWARPYIVTPVVSNENAKYDRVHPIRTSKK